MNISRIQTFILFSVALSFPVFSENISNGDFQTGNFTGWSLDSDGLGDPSPSTDFAVVESNSVVSSGDIGYGSPWNVPGNYTAKIEADFTNDTVQFANTLYQTLNLNMAQGKNLVLSFDWLFKGGSATPDDSFKVGLGHLSQSGSLEYYDASGNLGFLVEQFSYGSGSFYATLDPSFANQTGWTIEFQLLRGFDNAGSLALIDNVTLQEVNIPVPNTLWLFGVGLAGLIRFGKKKP